MLDIAAVYRAHAGALLFSSGDVLHPAQEGHDLEADMLYARLMADGL